MSFNDADVTSTDAVKKDRLWRKNRMQYNESISFSEQYQQTCVGVDLNRNFDFQWGTGINRQNDLPHSRQ